MEKKYTIIAPHPDDEIIGCWRLLEAALIKKVFYLKPINDTRRKELKNVAEYYEFEYECNWLNDIHKQAAFDDYNHNEIYLVPSLQDYHPLHKRANAFIYGKRGGIYTTNMNTEYTRELTEQEQQRKRKILNEYYPSQKSLWENNWKYFLFEGTVIEI